MLNSNLIKLIKDEIEHSYDGSIESFIKDIESNLKEENSVTKFKEKQVKPTTDIIVELQNIGKFYEMKAETVKALDDVNFKIYEKEITVIMGASGSGKTTALQLIGGLDQPTSGKIIVNNQDISNLNELELAKYRNKTIGFVFQLFYLQPYLNVLENIMVPLLLRGLSYKEASIDAQAIAEAVGLTNRTSHLPSNLSGGQMQRVAIARALVGKPKILLADEPTANLDAATAKDIMELFNKIIKDFGTSVVIVTHDPRVANQANRVIKLSDGKVI